MVFGRRQPVSWPGASALRKRAGRLLSPVSAAELIEQIKALPPEEQEVVRNFVLNGDHGPAVESGLKYLDREEARALGAKIMEEQDELFRRLAQ